MASYVCRRLILFLDGTWNDDEEDAPATNVVYLRELLFWGLQRRLDRAKGPPTDENKVDREDYRKLDANKAASGMIFDGFEYVVYYGRGVGTSGLVDRVKGGALGIGLDKDIRRAYKFLSHWFRPGDEIFIFGFSRGSFTARSLGGYLHAVGLLRCEHCTPENENRAWSLYRTPPQDRLSGNWEFFRRPDKETCKPLVHDASAMRIRALSVFDTVGALGVPGNLLRQFNRSKYEFHDTDVNSSIDIRLHAMAIDEPRPEFVASVWTRPKFQRFNDRLSPTEQVWFAGAHGDVGGGYVKWTDKGTYGLSHIPLAWMIQRLNYHLANTDPLADPTTPQKPVIEPRRRAMIPFFPVDFFEDETYEDIKQVIREQVSADQHAPWEWVSLLRPDNLRVINQVPVEESKRLQTKGRIQHADPIGEMIHVSAFQRLFKKIKIERRSSNYASRNLVAAIPFIAASYWRQSFHLDTSWKPPLIGPIFSWARIYVVDWNGMRLDPANPDHAKRVFEIIPAPDKIGLTEMPSEMENFLIPQRAASVATLPVAGAATAPLEPGKQATG